MRSMTGFGIGEATVADADDEAPNGGKVTIEIRAVNHRFLDVRVRAHCGVPDIAPAVEALAREHLTRGRFDIAVRIDSSALGAMVLDHRRARSVFEALTSLRDELAPNAEVPLSLLGAVPELFVPSLDRERDSLNQALLEAFQRALASLNAMRVREGRSLAEDLLRRIGTIRRLMQSITARAPLVVEGYKKRLKERAERLRLAVDVDIDQARLEQELALFADRIDIAEELTRLESHSTHFEALLASTDAIGRRLDFLLQEMAREANTIGAKCQDVGIAHAVVELKAEIERMREQVQNVE